MRRHKHPRFYYAISGGGGGVDHNFNPAPMTATLVMCAFEWIINYEFVVLCVFLKE